MLNKKIAIIGCGNLGQSILRGLIESKNYLPSNIFATRRSVDVLSKYKDQGVKVGHDNIKAVVESRYIILSLKPHNVLNELKLIAPYLTADHVIISLSTGITISSITSIVGGDFDVFRAMPNTATDVRESLTCLCTTSVNEALKKDVSSIFDSLGETIEINEGLMESATVLGACGIAFVLRFIRAMMQGGIQIGFDAETSSKIVTQTVRGATELLITRKEHPEFEIYKVTTPRGCTITGLNEMEHNGFSSALIKGITTSYNDIKK